MDRGVGRHDYKEPAVSTRLSKIYSQTQSTQHSLAFLTFKHSLSFFFAFQSRLLSLTNTPAASSPPRTTRDQYLAKMKLSSVILFFSATLATASPLEVRAGKTAISAAGATAIAPIAQGSGTPDANTTAVEERGVLQARNKYDWIQWTQSWTFNNGVPVGGDSLITIWSTGNAQFKSHFHDSGFPSYDVAVTCVLRDTAGRAYNFARSGRMYGTMESGSRDFNADVTKYNPDIQAHWTDIENGDLLMHCNAHAGSTINFASIQQWLKDILGVAQTVAQIINVF